MERKIRKMFSVFKIIAFELGAANSRNPEKDTGYLSSAINVLTNTSKIWHINKVGIFIISSSQSHQKIWSKCSHTDFTSVWDTLTCWLSKNVLKRSFLESGLTKILTVCNFENTLAMMITFLFKMFKIWWRFQKWNKNLRKRFAFLRQLHFNWEGQILTMLNRILIISSQCVNRHS